MSTTPTLVTPSVGSHDHDHGHGHGAEHRHVHAPVREARRANVSPSLLRASLGQRLAVAVPVAVALWVLALWVIQGGAA